MSGRAGGPAGPWTPATPFTAADAAAATLVGTPGAELATSPGMAVITAIRQDPVYGILRTSPNYTQSGVPL